MSVPGRPTPHRIPCVGAVLRDDAGRLLLVRRANPPNRGTWSLPGGRVEAGENDAAAVVREVAEETGLTVRPDAVLGIVHRAAPTGDVYVITDLACTVLGGALQAGDDAADVDWFSPDDLACVTTSPGLLAALTGWGVVPSPPP